MEPKDKEIQSELESFREQWRAEVSARARPPVGTTSRAQQSHNAHTGPAATPPPAHRKTPFRTLGHLEDEDEYVQSLSFDEPAPAKNTLDGHAAGSSQNQEPETALEFYEKAVDKETSGSLGDSLHLYRKAFRMDSRVDHEYKQKHFAAAWKMKPQSAPAQDATTSKSPPAAATSKPAKCSSKQIPPDTNPSNVPPTVPTTAHHSLDGPVLPVSISELIGSFANIMLEPAPPEIEGVAPPPCPIADVPGEILVHILRDVAIADVGDFLRLSRVCKRFAYLVATEDQIWRRICVGTEFGFGGMHYHWQQDHHWQALPLHVLAAQGPDSPGSPSSTGGEGEDGDSRLEDQVWTISELADRRAASSYATTMALVHSPIYAGSWQRMFRRRPRVRFNGCYISTVNYIRAGQASGHHITWNSPVHIVTYYRYLRLFRDGSAISLLTTDEPTAVVHHLTKENLLQHADRSTGMHLPSAFMSHALKGRWRLSSALDNVSDDNYPGGGGDDGGAAAAAGEGELYVETEGVGKKYMYRMELSVKGAGKKAIGNNRLQWKGYWSYNTLTDDWAQFGLKNDKAFFFSRVKSYGFGL